MKRRALLKSLLAGGAAAGLRVPLAQAADYQGNVFAFIQADGGWDPTSFCDPKTNTPGEPVITHWAERDDTRQAGNIPYAPFAQNVQFFEKYHSRMLVINGVDAQTNSHTTGVVHNWSGRNAEGYPTTTALLAGHYGPELPVSYLSFGGFSYPGGLVRPTRLNSSERLRSIATPAVDSFGRRHFTESDWKALESYAGATAERLSDVPNLLMGDIDRREAYRAAFAAEGLREFADVIPARNFSISILRRHAQLAVLAFRTGVAVSADLWIGGFDTHAQHDASSGPLLGELTGAVDYLWDYAELQGIADPASSW